jgi:hypothetical protein
VTAPRSTGGGGGNAAEMRRLLMRMVVAVVVVHTVGLAIFLLADLEQAGDRTRRWYVAGWAIVTFAVVMPFLRRIRMIRRGATRRR